MTHGALGMLGAILTFQNGADLEPTHRQPLFSILALGTCTGRLRTHRTANDLIRKRLLRRRSYSRGGSLSICQQIKLSAAYLGEYWHFKF